MSDTMDVRIPDLGGAEKVQIVEILVSVGDTVAADDGLITLESDKASMDVPSPDAGIISEILVEVGGQVEEGQVIVRLGVDEGLAASEAKDHSAVPQKGPAQRPALLKN